MRWRADPQRVAHAFGPAPAWAAAPSVQGALCTALRSAYLWCLLPQERRDGACCACRAGRVPARMMDMEMGIHHDTVDLKVGWCTCRSAHPRG